MSRDIKAEVIAALKDLREALKPRAVIFDLDGVLVDSSERFKRCESESGGDRRRFWDCFLSEKYMDLDRPRPEYVELAKRYAAQGFAVIIVTGRVEEKQRSKTIQQLTQWGVTFSEIYFRQKNDYRKDHELKTEIIRRLSSRYRIVAVYEDSQAVAEALKKLLPDAEIHLVQP